MLVALALRLFGRKPEASAIPADRMRMALLSSTDRRILARSLQRR